MNERERERGDEGESMRESISQTKLRGSSVRNAMQQLSISIEWDKYIKIISAHPTLVFLFLLPPFNTKRPLSRHQQQQKRLQKFFFAQKANNETQVDAIIVIIRVLALCNDGALCGKTDMQIKLPSVRPDNHQKCFVIDISALKYIFETVLASNRIRESWMKRGCVNTVLCHFNARHQQY